MRGHPLLPLFLASVAFLAPAAALANDGVTAAQAANMANGALALANQAGNQGGATSVNKAAAKEKKEELEAARKLQEAAQKLEQGRVHSLQQLFDNWQKYIDALKAELRRLEDLKKKKEQELAAELAKPPEQQDQAKIQRLRREIEDLRKKIEALKKKIPDEEANLRHNKGLRDQANRLRPQVDQNPQVADQIRALAGQATDQGVNRDLSLFADAAQVTAAAKKDVKAIQEELDELEKLAGQTQQNQQQLASQPAAAPSTITGSTPASYPTPNGYNPGAPDSAPQGGQKSQQISRADFGQPYRGYVADIDPRKGAGQRAESDITADGYSPQPRGGRAAGLGAGSQAQGSKGKEVPGGYNKPKHELQGFSNVGSLSGGVRGMASLGSEKGNVVQEELLAGQAGGASGPAGGSGTSGSGSGPGQAPAGYTGSPRTLASHDTGPLGSLHALEVLAEDSQDLFRRVKLVHNRCESFGCVRYAGP